VTADVKIMDLTLVAFVRVPTDMGMWGILLIREKWRVSSKCIRQSVVITFFSGQKYAMNYFHIYGLYLYTVSEKNWTFFHLSITVANTVQF